MKVTPVSVRVSSHVKCRICEDGIVVFVPATCETHILSTSLSSLFKHEAAEIGVVDDGSDAEVGDGHGSVRRVFVSPHIVNELVGLKIFDVIS